MRPEAGAATTITLIDGRQEADPEGQFRAIFGEFHPLDNSTGERGLGLAIEQRLADLLGHSVDVQSRLGEGTFRYKDYRRNG